MSDKLSLKELRLGIADIVISVIPEGNGWKLKLNGAIQRFTSRGEPDIVLKTYYGSLPNLNLERQIFNSGGNWTLFKSRNEWIFSLRSPITGPLPYILAIVNSNFKSGNIYVREFNSLSAEGKPLVNPLEYPLDEVLMVNLLSKGRGVLVHACGINYKEKGFLFMGTSGSGKSTIANLWKKERNASILSDDRVIICKIDSKFWIYGTPWHGDAKLCLQKRARLENIFFLKHNEENIVRGIDLAESLSRLIVCSFPTFWDKKGMEFTLDFCSELAQDIPCYELDFVPDESILDFVRNLGDVP